jgi:hypothetical protein
MLLRNTLLACMLAILAGAPGFALKIDGTPPKTGDVALDTQIEAAFNDLLFEINNEVKNIDSNPKKLIRGFADASVFAGQGASQRGYGDYKLFAFTLGPMIGLRFPGSNPFAIADELRNIADTLGDKRDVALGLDLQALTGQFSLNTSAFLLDGLSLGIRFGYFNLQDIEGFGNKTWSLGLTGNYRIIKGANFAGGLVGWRGLGAGISFIYQNTHLTYAAALDSQSVAVSSTPYRLDVDPKLYLDLNTNTFTIPLEIYTAVRLFWVLNLSLGAGVDAAFGNADLELGAKGDFGLSGGPESITTPGKLVLTAGGERSPTVLNPKLTAGIGFSVGPVIVDIPFTWYFLGNGFNFGVTLGAAW